MDYLLEQPKNIFPHKTIKKLKMTKKKNKKQIKKMIKKEKKAKMKKKGSNRFRSLRMFIRSLIFSRTTTII